MLLRGFWELLGCRVFPKRQCGVVPAPSSWAPLPVPELQGGMGFVLSKTPRPLDPGPGHAGTPVPCSCGLQ